MRRPAYRIKMPIASSTNISRRRPALTVIRFNPSNLLLQTFLHLRRREQLLRQALALHLLVGELVVRLTFSASLFPPVDGIVYTHGCNADAEDIHQNGLVALAAGISNVCRIGRPGLLVALPAGFVGFGGLVDVVCRGNGGDSCEAGVDVLFVAQFLLLVRLGLGHEYVAVGRAATAGVARAAARVPGLSALHFFV